AEWQEAAGRSRSDVVAYIAERAKLLEERDAAMASFKNFHRLLCERFGYTHDEKDWQRDQLSLIEHIAAAQAQHSVPEEFIGRLFGFLAQRGTTGKALLRELRALCAAAPGKEVGHE
ncbi:TPA: hypothetical protein ACHSVW_006099, partial [Pseudomonas aeruginosa]